MGKHTGFNRLKHLAHFFSPGGMPTPLPVAGATRARSHVTLRLIVHVTLCAFVSNFTPMAIVHGPKPTISLITRSPADDNLHSTVTFSRQVESRFEPSFGVDMDCD